MVGGNHNFDFKKYAMTNEKALFELIQKVLFYFIKKIILSKCSN